VKSIILTIISNAF